VCVCVCTQQVHATIRVFLYCVYACLSVLCICVCVCRCGCIHTHIHTHIHAYTHTHIHTCRQRRLLEASLCKRVQMEMGRKVCVYFNILFYFIQRCFVFMEWDAKVCVFSCVKRCVLSHVFISVHRQVQHKFYVYYREHIL
jgi:hypothetical protein